jgi:hypothetical protein
MHIFQLKFTMRIIRQHFLKIHTIIHAKNTLQVISTNYQEWQTGDIESTFTRRITRYNPMQGNFLQTVLFLHLLQTWCKVSLQINKFDTKVLQRYHFFLLHFTVRVRELVSHDNLKFKLYPIIITSKQAKYFYQRVLVNSTIYPFSRVLT